MHHRARWLLLIAALAVSPALALVDRPDSARDPRWIDPPELEPREPKHNPGVGAPGGAAISEFQARAGGSWEFFIDERTARPTLVSGSGIPLVPGSEASAATVEDLAPFARAFVDRHAALLAPPRGTLKLDRKASSIRGKLASFYFRWEIDGVPVERARVFVRANSGNVTQFGAPGIGPIDLDTRPAFGAEKAVELLMAYAKDEEVYRLQGTPELRIQPEGSERIEYRLVWRVVYKVPGRHATWEGRVDAHSGEIVGFRDINAYGRVVGGVHPRLPADAEVTVPFPSTDVVNDGLPVTSDLAGGFAYAGGTAASGLDGRWFDTSCVDCNSPAQPSAATSLGTGRIDFGVGGVDATGNGSSTPADRDTFYHLNQVRRIAKGWLPDVSWLDTTIASNVNIVDTCNAFYDGGVNFFRSGGGCVNSGEIADIVYHEWGHGLDLNTLAGDSATGEGTADAISIYVTHSPIIAPDFFDDGRDVRNLDPNGPRGLMDPTNALLKCPMIGFLGPLQREVHCEGEILGQTAWDMAQAMIAKYGHHTGWRTAERLFFTALPDTGSYLWTVPFFPVYDAYLLADDDDGDLANGTPNAAEIYDVFNLHGIAAFTPPASSTPCSRPAQPSVQVAAQCDRFELSWDPVAGADRYEILRGELSVDRALFSLGSVDGTKTDFTDLEVAPGQDYSYVVMAVDATGCESTIENPVPARLTEPVLSIDSVIIDDAPLGNRSGFADPGESVDLIVSLTNYGDQPAAMLSGSLVTDTPGVTLVADTSTWPQIGGGQAATNLQTLRFDTDPALLACGDGMRFRFVPDEPSGCATETSYFDLPLGESIPGTGFVCDDTPPCTVPPTFAGLSSAVGGGCGATDLAWAAATSQCQNATVSYNVYRDTDPDFVPGPATLVAEGVTATSFEDSLLDPARLYHYVVRAFDSRSGEDDNLVRLAVVTPDGPDSEAPQFAGIEIATTLDECGAVRLSWSPATESCSRPVSYEIYRGTESPDDFFPNPLNRIGSSLSTTFEDAALVPGVDHTYVVRARDAAGNEEQNLVTVTIRAGITDRVIQLTTFDPDEDGWAVGSPNTATAGNWEWGDPEGTLQQPEDDATEGGVNCWVTGLAGFQSGGGTNDVDGGVTNLLSRPYDMTGLVNPAVSYARWFTNDQGPNPDEDPFSVFVSNDEGQTWTPLEQITTGTPLAWVTTRIPKPQGVRATDRMFFRVDVQDLAGNSLVEAAFDDFAILDLEQGCLDCATPVPALGTVLASRSGGDVVLDWSDDPTPGSRFVVYSLRGATFGQALRVGSTDSRSFTHTGAAQAGQAFFYRVSNVNPCGEESPLE